MNQNTINALENADWQTLSLKLTQYALWRIIRLRWRGFAPPKDPRIDLAIDGKSPVDFVNLAIEKLYRGDRTFHPQLTLEQNLRGIICSEISNFHKQAETRPLDPSDGRATEAEIEEGIDPVEEVPDPAQGRHGPEKKENLLRQLGFMEAFKQSLSGDVALTKLVATLETGIQGPEAIEAATGLPARCISALKRQLRKRIAQFRSANPECAELAFKAKKRPTGAGPGKATGTRRRIEPTKPRRSKPPAPPSPTGDP